MNQLAFLFKRHEHLNESHQCLDIKECMEAKCTEQTLKPGNAHQSHGALILPGARWRLSEWLEKESGLEPKYSTYLVAALNQA